MEWTCDVALFILSHFDLVPLVYGLTETDFLVNKNAGFPCLSKAVKIVQVQDKSHYAHYGNRLDLGGIVD